MHFRKADINDIETIQHITLQTISTIYPRYYPAGAVEFFIDHHNRPHIEADIINGDVFLLINTENIAAGTVTIKGNEICRLFVLPDFQKKGYGRMLIRFAETVISEKYDHATLDASLPAKSIYLKYGYQSSEYHTIETANGDFLCYDVMTLRFL